MTQKNDEWENFKIDFNLHCSTFPDSKIYAKIFITPESARSMIKSFQLIVNDCERTTFSSALYVVVIGGFDRKKGEKISIAIRAIPQDDSKFEPKQSNVCHFSFNGQIFNLNPILRFDWDENQANLIVLWPHLLHPPIEKYILLLDEQEIQYVYRRDFQPQYRFYIHNLKANTKHTLQIIGKVKKKRGDCRSDLIHITIPNSKNEDQSNGEEILYVQSEVIPQTLKEFTDSDSKKEESSESMLFQQNCLRLLEKLRLQIEERNRRCRQPN